MNMVSTRTQNRLRKIELLKESLGYLIDILLLEHKQRERINMSEYKEICSKLKILLEKAKTSEQPFGNF